MTTTTTPLHGIAIISKRNEPILIMSFMNNDGQDEGTDSQIELELTLHSNLDCVEERILLNQNPASSSAASSNYYLGLLSLMGTHATCKISSTGWMTATSTARN